jgi:hypothetical protein
MLVDRAFAAIWLLLLVPIAQAGEASTFDETPLDELETVVIVGGFATPKMWKVSKEDHVMWVLENRSAPAGVKWRSEQLEARVAESQLVLYPGWASAAPDIGVFRAIGMLTLLPSAFKAAKNPADKTLKDVLPPETYTRWLVLKTAYVGRDNDIERWRPSIALAMLEEKISEKLSPAQHKPAKASPSALGPRLQPMVDKAAKKYKVKTSTMPNVERKVEVKNVRGMLKSVRDVSLVDVKCVDQYLDYLDRKIESLKQQASGTAQGNAPAPGSSCNESDLLIKAMRNGAIPDPAGIVKVFDQMELQMKLGREQLDAEWIAAAQAAIAKNKSTIALLLPNRITSPTGYIAKLKELGYSVEEADSTLH